MRLSQKYRYYVGLQPFVLVSDLDLLKKMTVTDFECFMDRPVSIYHGKNSY